MQNLEIIIENNQELLTNKPASSNQRRQRQDKLVGTAREKRRHVRSRAAWVHLVLVELQIACYLLENLPSCGDSLVCTVLTCLAARFVCKLRQASRDSNGVASVLYDTLIGPLIPTLIFEIPCFRD